MARKLRYKDEEGAMVKAQLQKIETYAAKLNDMIHPDDELEGWVQSKLAVVAAYMGDVKHYLDYELKQSFGEGGGVSMKERHWEVEFTWEGADDEGRKVNIMADSVSDAEKKVKDKFGPYYKGLRIVEVEEDKEMTWDEYAEKRKSGKMVSGGVAGSKYQIAQGYWKQIEESMTPKQKALYKKQYKRLESKFDQFNDREIAEYIQGSINEYYDDSFKLTKYEISGPNWFKLGYKYIAHNDAVHEPDWYEEMSDGGTVRDWEEKLEKLDNGGTVVEKAFVEITKPTDLKTKAVADKIDDLIDQGYRAADILLKMAFVTADQKLLEDQFQVLKNKIFLEKAMGFRKQFDRGGGVGDVIMKHQGSSFYEDMQEAREHLGEEVWSNFSLDEKIAATEYLKAQGHIGYYGEEESLETLAAMQYKKGGKS